MVVVIKSIKNECETVRHKNWTLMNRALIIQKRTTNK